MNNEKTILVTELIDTKAADAEQRLQRFLQATVRRKRHLRRFSRMGLASIALVFATLMIYTLPGAGPLPGTLEVLDTLSVTPQMPVSPAAQADSRPLISLVNNTVQVEYVNEVPDIEYVPTRSLIVTSVDDEQLIEVFEGRAYAIVEDENEQINSFHLLEVSAELGQLESF